MPELQHHLIPRSKGFTASLPFLKNKCPGLYDIQLAFKADDKYEPTVANLLHGHSVNGYMHVRRIDMKSIPDGEDEAAEWLQNLFREKDELQESFHKHGDFFTGSRFKKVEPVLQKPSLATLLNTVIWSIVTLTPMLYYLVRLLFSGELLYFSIGVAIITICKLILSLFLCMCTEIRLLIIFLQFQSIYLCRKRLECQRLTKDHRMVLSKMENQSPNKRAYNEQIYERKKKQQKKKKTKE